MKIVLFSRYDTLGASSRIRSFQYLPFLQSNGIEVIVLPLFGNDYLNTLYLSLIHISEPTRPY